MKKFKINKYKFLFARKLPIGTDYKVVPEVDYQFGNRETENLNKYDYHKYHMGWFFADYMDFEDDRRYNNQHKFTESEAQILLLAYIEEKFKMAKKEKRNIEKIIERDRINEQDPLASYMEYRLNVNKREVTFFENAAKKHRKIVKDLKKSPQYLWEQLLK